MQAPAHMMILTAADIEGGAVGHADQAAEAVPGCWHYRDGTAEVTVWPEMARAAYANGADSDWGDVVGDEMRMDNGIVRTLTGSLAA